jgi:cell division protein FtsI (penicillin-binding protein 3)
MEKRLLIAGAVLGCGLLLVLGRLVHLTTIHNEDLARQASQQHLKKMEIPSRRGAIVDRNGEPLALSVPAESLFIRPRKLPTDANKWIVPVATALHAPLEQVSASFRSAEPFVWLKRRATPQEAAQIRAYGIGGIDSIETERRFYPQGMLAAPLIGFTDVDARGIAGIEQTYDRYLREEPAELVGERDALGRMILAHGVAASPEVLNVRLTLDIGIQNIAERELSQAVRMTGAEGGTVVVLDPQTFTVLALAQVPTFDPNTPAAVRPERRRNRTVGDCYEPGSTMKVLLTAAALDAKRLSPDEKIFCEYGRYAVGRSVINDSHSHGWLSVTQVIQQSSNIGAAKIAEHLGKETYAAYLRAFGFGRLTEIELPGESPGILPLPHTWGRIHLVTASFGQGFAVTPLQLASAYAALANGGTLMRPYLVSEVLNSDGKVVEARNPQRLLQVVSRDTAKLMMGIMEQVTEGEGTGTRARVEGFRVAGKTGTSQKPDPRGGYSARDRIASFVGIVPAEQPRLVILVVVDTPRTGVYGGQIAAPVFQAIAKQSLAYLGVEGEKPKLGVTPAIIPAPSTESVRENSLRQAVAVKTPEPQSEYGLGEETDSDEPNFIGMSLRDAVLTAQRNGWQIVTQGSGYVEKQTVRRTADTLVYELTLTSLGGDRP